MDYLLFLFISGAVLLLGYISRLFFERFGFPDVLWLLLAGVALGPVFGVVDASSLLEMSDFVSSIAIIILLFGGGMALKAKTLLKSAQSGLILMFARLILGIVATTAVMVFFGYGLLQAILMGLVLGGTSFAVVVPLVNRLKGVQEETRAMLAIESITDNFSMVLAFAVMGAILLGSADATHVFETIVSSFSVGAVAGLLLGLACIPLLIKFKIKNISYILVLSMLFLLYPSLEYFGWSGAMAMFTFGIVIGNAKDLLKGLIPEAGEIEVFMIEEPHRLVTFFVHTFFFVFLGIVITINDWGSMLVGLLIAFSLVLVKQLSILLIQLRGKRISDYDLRVMRLMVPIGLSAAVMGNIIYVQEVPGTQGFLDIIFSVVLVTVTITAVGVFFVTHEKKSKEKEVKKTRKKKRGKRRK